MKLTILLLGLFASTACIAKPDCMTNGGAAVYGSSLCSEFSKVESRALQARVAGMPEKFRLDGWTILVHTESWIPHDVPYLVNGITRCSQRLIELNDKTWHESTLAHEIMHARENCPPADHPNWVERGVYKAIQWASGAGL